MFYSKLNLHFATYKERKLFYKVFVCYVMNKRNIIYLLYKIIGMHYLNINYYNRGFVNHPEIYTIILKF